MGMTMGRGFWGRRSAAMHFDNSSIQSRENLLFELSLYDLKQDSLIWTGNGQVTDPESMSEIIETLSSGMIKQWQAIGLMTAKK